MTANDLAGSSGKHPDTIRKRWAREFPGVPYSGTAELSAEELRVLSGKENGTRNAVRKTKEVSPTPARIREVVETETAPVKKRVDVRDALFVFVNSIAAYGMFEMLSAMGVIMGLIYVGASIDLLLLVKNPDKKRTATKFVDAVWGLELVAFPFHLSLANLKLWQNKDHLPFQHWEHWPWIWYCSIAIAIALSGAAIYFINLTLNTTNDNPNT